MLSKLHEAINLTGQKFGHLTVIGLGRKKLGRKRTWLCKCDCGGEIEQPASYLRMGTVNSDPGCKNCYAQRMSKLKTIHGLCGKDTKSKLHGVWASMKQRCHNKNDKKYYFYGLRGISVCKEWHEYPNFYYWAISHGYRDGLTIDRVDSDKNYEPENCEWVTSQENGRRAVKSKMKRINNKNKIKLEDYILGQLGLAA